VTGDKQLLSLKQHKSTKIIIPAAMIELLKRRGKGRETEVKQSPKIASP